MANASAILFDALSDINWAGFYTVAGESLLLGPFQGKVACVNIAKGKGVVGVEAQSLFVTCECIFVAIQLVKDEALTVPPFRVVGYFARSGLVTWQSFGITLQTEEAEAFACPYAPIGRAVFQCLFILGKSFFETF